MSGEKKVFWTVVAVAAAVIGILFALPEVEERVAPDPRTAWVGIEVEGSGVARVGPVEIEAGTPFTLHAVLEAETRRGETIYYTEAPALAFPDGRSVDPASLRPWPSDRPVRVLWFTVEGPSPYLELGPDQSLDEVFQLTENLRSDWPFAWSVRGQVEPANDDLFSAVEADAEAPFGTLRYQVRIELAGDEAAVLPEARFVSWGKEMLPERVAEFPTAIVHLPGVARPATEVFGLTQIESPVPAVREAVVELTARRLAFARLPLLSQVLGAAGVSAEAVPWRSFELSAGLAWGDEVRAGDLLQAGGRVVVLYRDAAPAAPPVEGVPAPSPLAAGPGDGRLDGADLVLDYVRGASVRRLSDVFDLSAGGTLAVAPIAARE